MAPVACDLGRTAVLGRMCCNVHANGCMVLVSCSPQWLADAVVLYSRRLPWLQFSLEPRHQAHAI